MSYNGVMELRRKGQWQQALDEALSYCRLLDDDWAHAALFWVVYDMAKLAIPMKEAENIAVKCFILMRNLLREMSDDQQIGWRCYYRLLESYMPRAAKLVSYEDLSQKKPGLAFVLMNNQGICPDNLHVAFHNSYGRIIYRYLCYRGRDVSLHRVKTLLYSYLKSSATRPSRLHSLVLSFAIDYANDHLAEFDINNFLMLWGLENLRKEDYFNIFEGGSFKLPIFDRLCKLLERCNGVESVLSLLDEGVIAQRQSLVAYLNLK